MQIWQREVLPNAMRLERYEIWIGKNLSDGFVVRFAALIASLWAPCAHAALLSSTFLFLGAEAVDPRGDPGVVLAFVVREVMSASPGL